MHQAARQERRLDYALLGARGGDFARHETIRIWPCVRSATQNNSATSVFVWSRPADLSTHPNGPQDARLCAGGSATSPQAAAPLLVPGAASSDLSRGADAQRVAQRGAADRSLPRGGLHDETEASGFVSG